MKLKGYLTAVVVFSIIDRFIKFLIASRIFGRFFIGDWFGIELFQNNAAIFGLPKISPYFEMLAIAAGVFLTIAIFFALRKKDEFLVIGLFLIILGGMSNFSDRLIYGYVVDMIHMGESVWNAADGMIAGGFVLAVFSILRKSNEIRIN